MIIWIKVKWRDHFATRNSSFSFLTATQSTKKILLVNVPIKYFFLESQRLIYANNQHHNNQFNYAVSYRQLTSIINFKKSTDDQNYIFML